MPRIELVGVPFYDGTYPYHWTYDNLPIQALVDRENLLNDAIDLAWTQLRDAAGDAGSIAIRLDQSINPDGSLRTSAVDEALHAIGAHTDGEYNGVDYVRMKLEERSKLELVASEATNMRLEFDTPSVTHVFDAGPVVYEGSESLVWRLGDNNRVQAHLSIPVDEYRRKWYDVEPSHADGFDPDYTNYKTTSLATPFTDGSLRVYVNGSRLSESASVYVPGPTPSSNWQLLGFTADPENGTFALSAAITADDVIRIDFDQPV